MDQYSDQCCQLGLIKGESQFEFLRTNEYQQEIKTFCLKYIILTGNITKKSRNVVMELSKKYPYREIYDKSLTRKNSDAPVRYYYLS